MIVLDREEMRRTVMRLSMEIIEKNKGADDLVLVGIRPRGVILAKKMRREIERIEGVTLPLGTLVTATTFRNMSGRRNFRAVKSIFLLKARTLRLSTILCTRAERRGRLFRRCSN